MKKYVFLGLVMGTLIFQDAYAQATWIRTFKAGGVVSGAMDTTLDGCYIVSGGNLHNLLKIDALGNIVWQREYLPDEAAGLEFTSVCTGLDGDYYLAGGFWWGENGPWNSVIIQAGPDGDTIDYFYYDEGSPHFVSSTSDTGCIATGYPHLLKLGEWEKIFGGFEDFWGECVKQTKDGGYVVLLYSWVNNNTSYIVKTDSLGQILWKNGISNLGYNWVEQTTDGGYILTGTTTHFDYGLVIRKFDSLGNSQWVKDYGEDENTSTSGNCVKQTTDGGYIVVGEYVPMDDFSPQLWLVRTDSLGDTLWTRRYSSVFEGSWLTGNSVVVTGDRGYVAGGSTQESETGYIMLIKTDSLGLGISEPPVTHQPSSPSSEIEIVSPIGSTVTLRYSNCSNGFRASVFDGSGRKVDEIKTSEQSGTLVWGKCYGPGVYFIVPQGSKTSPLKVILVR